MLSLVDRLEVGDLLGVGVRVERVDDHRAGELEDAPRLRVVGERIRRLQRAAPLGREVAERDEAIAGVVPVAEGAVVGRRRPRAMWRAIRSPTSCGSIVRDTSFDIATMLRRSSAVVFIRRLTSHRKISRKPNTRTSVMDATSALVRCGGQSIARAAGARRRGPTRARRCRRDEDSAERSAAEERQDEDEREQRGDRHGERDRRLEDGRHRDEDERDGGDSADRLGLSQVVEPHRDTGQPAPHR